MFKLNFENGFGRISTFSKPASPSSCLAFSRPHITPSPIASESSNLTDAIVIYGKIENQLITVKQLRQMFRSVFHCRKLPISLRYMKNQM